MFGALSLTVLVLASMPVYSRLMFMELGAVNAAHLSHQLDNQHIVMVGDSLTRYQYLSLVYLVHHGIFYVNNTASNILIETTFSNWSDFYTATNKLLSPNEYCDCYRGSINALPQLCENRYYYSKERNLSVSYIQYYGDGVVTRGHWQPSDSETNHQEHGPDAAHIAFHWQYPNIGDAIVNIAVKLLPKPSVLLLNAGHWPNQWGVPAFRDKVLSQILPLFERVVWKTTNYRSDQTPSPPAHDKDCPDPRLECMSLEWTKYLSPADFWNPLHFQAPIYTDVNIQFIHQLIKRKPLQVAPMEDKHHGSVVIIEHRSFLVDSRCVLRPFDAEIPYVCAKNLSARARVHMHVYDATKHLLGEKLPHNCSFVK